MRRNVAVMWLAYALGSAGGMTVISHVTGIVVSFSGSSSQVASFGWETDDSETLNLTGLPKVQWGFSLSLPITLPWSLHRSI